MENTNLKIAIVALLFSLTSLIWNIVKDIIIDKVSIKLNLKLGIKYRTTSGHEFFKGISELPAEQKKNVEINFSIVNVGRRPVVISRIEGELQINDASNENKYFFVHSIGLPAILKPYDIHNEFSGHISALERFKENRIKNVFVTDTKEKKWYASTKDIQRIVKELQEIDISNTHPQSHQTAHYD
jgi:hypothetical protein